MGQVLKQDGSLTKSYHEAAEVLNKQTSSASEHSPRKTLLLYHRILKPKNLVIEALATFGINELVTKCLLQR